MSTAILCVALGGACLAFLCSTYTTLRTLLPLLPGHPLNPRPPAGSTTLPRPQRPRLKSAQRFAAYLAASDILAVIVLVIEVALAVGHDVELGASRGAASRLYLATTARPTLLLVVAILSYTNVVFGRSIDLGRADWIVWLPALGLYGAGAGLAALPRAGSRNVWIGLASWLSAVTLVVTVCFGRLLIAILRVRRITQREQAFSPFAEQQQYRVPVSQGDMPYDPTLPAFRHNFSGLSTSFVHSIGRSTSTLDALEARPSFAPSRASTEGLDFDHARDFRSPTPGSAHVLLFDRSATATPASYLSGRRTPQLGPRLPAFEDEREVIADGAGGSSRTESVRSRVSLGSITSRASSYLAPSALVGNVGGAHARHALMKEAWGGQTPPGTGHSPKVELSSREARGALVRIGGHLLCSILSYALVSPFVFRRLVRPSSAAPLVTSILFILGVCLGTVVLAWQCWASEGFWFRRPSPPVLTSSTAAPFEGVTVESTRPSADMYERSQSRASTPKSWRTGPPGISPDGEDCAPTPRGTIGRAVSMLATHPRLQVLPSASIEPSSIASGFVKSASAGHARLRSLKLSKATLGPFGEFGAAARSRSGSIASRKTVGGFEHSRRASAPVHVATATDELIALSLLRTRKPSTDEPRLPDKPRVPFGFGRTTLDVVGRGRSRSRSRSPSPAVTPTDFHFSTRELNLTPTSSVPPAPPSQDAQPTIDYLSAHVLPHLVPSIKLGSNVKVGPEHAPMPRRPSSVHAAHVTAAHASSSLGVRSARSFAAFSNGGSLGSRAARTRRRMSLPVFVQQQQPSVPRPSQDVWVAVDETPAPAARTAQEEVRASSSGEEAAALPPSPQQIQASTCTIDARRASSSRGGSAKKWDEVEAAAREVEEAVEALGSRSPSPAMPRESTYRHLSTDRLLPRTASRGTLLDISFEWEEAPVEVLDDDAGTLADDSSSSDDDNDDVEAEASTSEADQQRRLGPPLSSLFSPTTTSFSSFYPTSPSAQPRRSPAGSVVLRGSQVMSDEDVEDALTGTVLCATVHPIGRDSDSDAAELSSFDLRPPHLAVDSISSARSLATPSNRSSLVAAEEHHDATHERDSSSAPSCRTGLVLQPTSSSTTPRAPLAVAEREPDENVDPSQPSLLARTPARPLPATPARRPARHRGLRSVR
ncbi:hypothetical protein JCM9279_004270 [Rhodotorula babjevae]